MTAANPFAGQPPQRVLVTGGTGFIGKALVGQLLDAGHAVTVLTRDPARAASLFAGRVACVRSADALAPEAAFDAVVNLAGAPVVGPRWTAQRKAKLLASRVGVTQALAGWLKRAPSRPAVWVQASAVGFYGVRDPGEALTEDSPAGRGFQAELCVRLEDAAREIADLGVRVVVLRLGLVFGPKGGALPALLLPYRFGLGARLGDGRQVMSWVHRDDVLALVARSLGDASMRGAWNAVAPETVAQADFAAAAGRALHRPVWLRVPAAPVRLLAGEMAQLFVDGQRVVPQRLLDAGYAFRFPTLRAALEDLV